MLEINPSWLYISPWLIATVIICSIAFVAISINWGIRAHRRQASAGKEDLIGRIAEVDITLDPKGVVLIEGERWTAISDQGRVKRGEEVIVTKVNGLKLHVVKKG